MSSPGILPIAGGAAVLGTKLVGGSPLAATGIAVGAYVAIGVGCIIAGATARFIANRREERTGS